MGTSSFWTYLLYALGEVILVVVGILIAVAIDNKNEAQKAHEEELASYEDIIADLKKDSAHFQVVNGIARKHMDTYYQVYAEFNGHKSYNQSINYDLLGSTIPFSPITELNHRSTIDKIEDVGVRDELNTYFTLQNVVRGAVEELNIITVNEVRPYLFNNQIVSAEKIFHEDKYGFFPKTGGITDFQNLKEEYGDQELLTLLTASRISTGLIIVTSERLMNSNNQLIAILNQRLIENTE